MKTKARPGDALAFSGREEVEVLALKKKRLFRHESRRHLRRFHLSMILKKALEVLRHLSVMNS